MNSFLPLQASRSLRLPCRTLCVTSVLFAGHNKWSKIKHKKGMEDAKKSSIYGKASRDILVAVRNGGSADPEKNNMLSAALKKARTIGVPKDTIEAALSRAARSKDGGENHLALEALAVNGSVGLIIECLTNNQNRTLHNIRDVLTRNSAYFASVGFMFERKGCVRIALAANDDPYLEKVIDQALASTAEDFDEVERSNGAVELKFTCSPQELAVLTSALNSPDAEHEILASELIYSPKDSADASNGEDVPLQVAELVAHLEDDQDCLRVWTTLD